MREEELSGEDEVDRGSPIGLPKGERRSVVVLDACVLFAAAPRDLLLELGAIGAFQPKWTEDIHAEWMRGLRRARPDIPPERLEALRRAIDGSVPDCLVRGHLPLVSKLALPDASDRHVLAAAIRCKADLVVTFNLKHFPTRSLADHGVRAVTPARLAVSVFERAPAAVCEAVRRMRARLRNPPHTAESLLDLLARRGLPRASEALRPHARRL